MCRFYAKVDQSAGEDGCWPWTGTIKNQKPGNGYGGFTLRGKDERATRASWVLNRGEIPDGQHVLHHCDNPQCVNPGPRHLFLGTQLENMKDRNEKGRSARLRGELNGHTRLTAADVVSIRARWAAGTATQSEMGREYGMRQSVIWGIINRRSWRHIA